MKRTAGLEIFLLLSALLGIVIAPVPAVATPDAGPATVEAVINGLQIIVDAHSGSVLKLAYPGPGIMLESSPGRAGIIDLAYPVKEFEPLRLASRYSSGAHITKTEAGLTIHWDKLGPSRSNFELPGAVSVTVRLAAHPDGRSIVMTAEVVNNSRNEVRQVLFPDLPGLLPFAGENGTFFRTGSFAGLPFLELAKTEDRESMHFVSDPATYAAEFGSSDGLYGNMIVRWMDFGGLKGGLSLFPKVWGFAPQVRARLQRSELETKIRLMLLHDVDLKEGAKWESGEYVLTPHRHGWAEGIEAYRAWVKQNLKRAVPVPKHVREGLGFRTIWMCQNRPNDPKDAIFKFSDLPKLARECREHGIDEMVFWAWSDFFTMPLPAPYAHLGTEHDLTEAVKECKKMGVNAVPFISVLLGNAGTAPRYGAKVVPGSGGWTYHTELIPRFNPPYASGSATVQVGPVNRLWQQDVLAGTRHLVDIGIPSLCWDQFWTTPDPEPNQISLANQIREYSRRADPEATFSGEELWNMDIDAAVLDYTWNWLGYRDCRAFTSVFPAPRVNCNVSSSPLVLKKAFADNLYINVMPRKPESVNGTDWIANRPELSQALKQCAGLRRRFLNDFVNGTLIGDGILAAPCPAAHICAYALPGRAILVMVNLGGRRAVDFDIDMGPWVTSPSGRYDVQQYNADGKLVASTEDVPAVWHGRTPTLAPEELTVLELAAKGSRR